jgi:hypothetical protein
LKSSSAGIAKAAIVNCAADRFGNTSASGPDGGPPPLGTPYSQSDARTAAPPTTALQTSAFATARRASVALRPLTTAIAWSMPNPIRVAASWE